MPTVLAISSDHAFASILMDKLATEYLMTSAPQINVPIGGGLEFMSTNLKDSVFQRPTGLLDASGAPIIKSSLRSIGAVLLMAVDHRELRIVGLLHPDAANSFNPQWLPMVPFVKFAGAFSHTKIATEWIQVDDWYRVASFPHRCVRLWWIMNKSTYCEDLLAAYLTAQGGVFEREPKLPGTSQLIDFVIDHPTHGKILLEVKDIVNPMPALGFSTFDP
jgi:hypothetical protein